ncbi:MAG: CDP-glycerol glycerophosphotransferase family protein [Rhodospirillales bacterium]|nr:CDP-glycerol glycerophosphotransferase family protein [Rhodospirillales bacterium]
MKLKPEKPANAALYFHPDAVESGGPRLMGRHAAGEGFFNGFVRHSEVDTFYCHAGSQGHFDAFRGRVSAIDSRGRECHWIPQDRPADLARPGCLWLPGPDVSGAAWRRRAMGQRAYSICGVNHTIASDRIMDALGIYLTAADLLVSDASSAAFQFLALDRPIVLVTNPDHLRDKQNYDPDGIEWAWRDVGEEVLAVEDLAAAVERGLEDPDRGAGNRAKYRERLFGDLTDGRVVKRIVERISGLGT